MSMTENASISKALIFMTARNCEKYVPDSLASLARQTLRDVHVLFIDDCSEDKTGAVAQQLLGDLFPARHTFIRNETRLGKARNAWEHLRPLTGIAEFVAVLDGDDQLVETTILDQMSTAYRNGKDVVWTNYITDKGLIGSNGPLNPDLPLRPQGWKTSHFFSFRASLFDTVPEHCFKDRDGEWLQAACDIALAMPMIDQTREYEYIPVNAYRYTSANPNSHHNLDATSSGLNSTVQAKNFRELFTRAPLPLLKQVQAEAAAPAPSQAPAAAPTPLPGPAQTLPPADRIAIASALNHVGTWQDLAGGMLMVECPHLMNALAFGGQSQMTPIQAWALRGLLQNRGADARILHIGATRSALVLAALSSLTDGRITSLCASAPEAEELRVRIAASGLADRVEIVETNVVQAIFDEFSGPFPDIRVIEEGTKFDFVMIDLPPTLPQASALVSLSVVANYLSPEGFALCLLARDRATEALAEERWRPISNGLSFCPNALGGSGLMIAGGR
ncbi:glycosyltransferase [Flaviflagellibacter deserti]|uniref:Glycosyltransferase n=1 Tax=Flaviflagellibacter deserti TaxID=2267266 RepID=A0ABV9Z7A0_9HYPH